MADLQAVVSGENQFSGATWRWDNFCPYDSAFTRAEYELSNSSLISRRDDRLRTVKPKRPVIVVSGDETNENPAWPIIFVVPISTSPTLKTPFRLQLGAGVGNLPSKG
ncbi:type II toxin-antitoxin system PemK/MazF family toxin [Nonomuraea glycinis]|uniref:Type II toxin-antitoxin system PemK/MazF family toxin n=1 Tax=Nonomuraea glycinis TaxID=2047744 RepID=A0A918A0L7_9ACTN|nr:type II toxin-antitoxin system PemK/MazF family toxin [Nonomuraea glycinis]MCA2174919.1 type II toxin-antitoxin system PemK/MazF family toxin [Nonomuraea glycinis]GGP01382.1 hypothetical protein GCM10012278_04450 [Nonomuraea glycinis]